MFLKIKKIEFWFFLWFFVGGLVEILSVQYKMISFHKLLIIDWDAVATAALLGTIYYLHKQTKAAETMAKQQMVPAVEVSMIYDQQKKKTYFWFSNNSNIPAHVLINTKLTFPNGYHSENSIGPYRIPPQTSDKPTSSTFFDGSTSDSDEYHKEGAEATILVSVKPDIEGVAPHIGTDFKKSYKFHDHKWDEKTWGGPDPESPLYNQYFYKK